MQPLVTLCHHTLNTGENIKYQLLCNTWQHFVITQRGKYLTLVIIQHLPTLCHHMKEKILDISYHEIPGNTLSSHTDIEQLGIPFHHTSHIPHISYHSAPGKTLSSHTGLNIS